MIGATRYEVVVVIRFDWAGDRVQRDGVTTIRAGFREVAPSELVYGIGRLVAHVVMGRS